MKAPNGRTTASRVSRARNRPLDSAVSAADPALGVFREYSRSLICAIQQASEREFAQALTATVAGLRAGRQIWIAGNGGSASTALHIASDLTAHAPVGAKHPIAIPANVATLTAVANDVAFEDVFAEPLRRFGKSGDLLLILSVSGSSPNVVRAAAVARSQNMEVVALTGVAGEVAKYSTVNLILGAGDFGVSEDLHLSFGHAAVRLLRNGAPNLVGDSPCAF